jgi:hypothetical protein
MIERVLPATSYETLLIAEAIKLASKFHKGMSLVEQGNRWGCPLSIYGLDTMTVNLRIDGERGGNVRVEFVPDFSAATVAWYAAKTYDLVEKKTKPSAGFREAFVSALKLEWEGRDPFAEKTALTKRSWYRTAPSDQDAEQSRDNVLHNRVSAAIALFVAVGTEKNAMLKFEYGKKALTGTFQGLKRWNRRAPPGGDPSSGYNAVIHSGGYVYKVGVDSLKGFAKAA